MKLAVNSVFITNVNTDNAETNDQVVKTGYLVFVRACFEKGFVIDYIFDNATCTYISN